MNHFQMSLREKFLTYDCVFSRYLFWGMLGLMTVYGLLNSIYGIEDIRLMQVFESDEMREVQKIIGNLNSDNLSPGGFHYGYLMNSIVFWVAKLFINFFNHTLSVPMIAFLSRLVSLASFVIMVILMVKIMLYFTKNKNVSYTAGIFLASVPDVYYWAVRVHPDILQLALVSLCILLVIKEHSPKFLFLASFVAGLSFGAKYSGVFLLPFLIIPLVLKWYYEKKPFPWMRLIMIFAISIILFVSAWLITNPYVITNWSEFQEDFLFEKNHVAYGHDGAEPKNPFLWIPVIAAQFTPFGAVMLLVGTLYWLFFIGIHFVRSRLQFLSDAKLRSVCFLLAYLIGATFYLAMEVNMREPRYLFHLFPAFVGLGVTGLYQFANEIAKTSGGLLMKRILLCAIWIPILIFYQSALLNMDGDSNKFMHPYLQAGNFLLDEGYSRDTRILADFYSYVPERFSHVQAVWKIDEGLVQEFQPQIIILNKQLSGRYSWKEEGTSFEENKLTVSALDNADQYYQFQKSIFSDSNWNIVYETEDVVILEDQLTDF